MLDGVQVLINDVPAPIYYVSPTQISVIVPYETSYSIAQIQVKNGGVSSNPVTLFVNKTAPGVFTQSEDGLGLGAVLHSNFSLVTESHPAQIGETVQVYLTGLGDVVPAVADGVAGPSSPLSLTTNTIAASIGGVTATVTFAGLAPGFAGLYQVNLVVPTGLDGWRQLIGYCGAGLVYSGVRTPHRRSRDCESGKTVRAITETGALGPRADVPPEPAIA